MSFHILCKKGEGMTAHDSNRKMNFLKSFFKRHNQVKAKNEVDNVASRFSGS